MGYWDDVYSVAALNLPWEDLQGCNILVAGATGLIGSTFVDVLMAKNQKLMVYACGRNEARLQKLFQKYLNKPNFQYILQDVSKPLSCNIRFDYVVHCASGAAPVDFALHPVEVMTANFLGVQNLLEYGRNHGLRRLLYVSSGEIYGEGDGCIFTENDSGYVNSMSPRSCYPSSKRASETLCVSYGAEYGIETVVARPCHVYGPHFTETDNRVYAQFIRNILNGEDIVMKSSGTQYRSWCYVVDCVSALLYVLLKGENGQAYNIADDSSNLTIRQLAEMIATIGGRNVVVSCPSETEKAGFNKVTKSLFSTTKLQSLGWRISDQSMFEKLKSTIQETKQIA